MSNELHYIYSLAESMAAVRQHAQCLGPVASVLDLKPFFEVHLRMMMFRDYEGPTLESMLYALSFPTEVVTHIFNEIDDRVNSILVEAMIGVSLCAQGIRKAFFSYWFLPADVLVLKVLIPHDTPTPSHPLAA